MLGSLSTAGNYQPNFIDYQTYITWSPGKKRHPKSDWRISLLGNFSQNTYRFTPDSMSESFGGQDAKHLTIYYEGQEKDRFTTGFAALGARGHVSKEVELEQKIENLTADVEATESDIKALKQEKADAEKARDQVRESKEQAEKELKHMEKQRNQLQPIINSIDKELKNSGQIKLVLPEVGALELASTYRNKKIKPLFAKMKNYIAGLAAKVIELSREAEKWRDKYQRLKKDYDDLEKNADKVADLCNQLCDDVDKLEVISDKYNRALRIFGKDTIESAIWHDIQREKALEEQKRKEQVPRKLNDRLQWSRERSQEYNMHQKNNKTKHRGMEL